MDLERQIRDSAQAQGTRYQPAADIAGRIEHRRRQRVARRATASGLAAAIVVAGAAFAVVGPLSDSRQITPSAEQTSTTADVVETLPAATTTTQSATTSTVTTTAPAVPPTQQVTTQPQPTAPPTSHANMAPAYVPSGGSAWTYGEFWNVPQMGTEPVRGSGCGGGGQIPAGGQIPDGLWAALIPSASSGPPAVVQLDLVCVYFDDARVGPEASVIGGNPGYRVVNNSTQVREMPMDEAIQLRLGVRDSAGRCVDGQATTQWSDIPADRQVWVRIHDGAVSWVFADCPPAAEL
jgi:hypothetical protein